MSKVITILILNQKGGVGKSFLAKHLAASLATRGMRVLQLDSDPQSNLCMNWGVRPAPAFHDWLVRGNEIDEKGMLAIIPQDMYNSVPNFSSDGVLAIMPGNRESRSIVDHMDDALLLRERIAELDDLPWPRLPRFDCVVIDAPPMPGMIQAALLEAADHVVYPTQCEYGSLGSLAMTIAGAQKKSHINHLGIVPTMYTGRKDPFAEKGSGAIEHTENLLALKERYGNLVTQYIPNRITIAECDTAHRPVWNWDKKAGAEVLAVMEELHNRLYLKEE